MSSLLFAELRALSILVKSLWPLPITGVLCVCVRWCPDDRRPQRAAAWAGEDCQANVRKGLALGCASITAVPAHNQNISHEVLCPHKAKAGFSMAMQCPDLSRRGLGVGAAMRPEGSRHWDAALLPPRLGSCHEEAREGNDPSLGRLIQ